MEINSKKEIKNLFNSFFNTRKNLNNIIKNTIYERK